MAMDVLGQIKSWSLLGLLCVSACGPQDAELAEVQDGAPTGPDQGVGPKTPDPKPADSVHPDPSEDHKEQPEETGPSYYGQVKDILDRKCVGCHGEGKIGPFEMGDYKSAFEIRKLIAHAVLEGTMPPWSPARGCQDYYADRSLSALEKETLLSWVSLGAREGDPAEFKPGKQEVKHVEFNLTMEMPEPYTPRGIDDNRCFLLPYPGDKVQYQRAFQVEPGDASMLHHLLVYKVPAAVAAAFHAIDAADLGPGYYCPGGPGPGIHPNGVELIADWVPGQVEGELPEGVGVAYHPGDLLIMQHHYNTAFTGKKPDQSKYHFKFVDEVEKPAVASLFFNPAWLVPGTMAILPGVEDTKHVYHLGVAESLTPLAMRNIPGYKIGDPLQVRFAGPHLHELGSSSSMRVRRANGEEVCMVDIPKWDFDWQGFYNFKSKLVVYPGDVIELECHWNNTAENQPPLPDGTVPPPRFVSWGDQTRDEMCLMGIMVTAVDDDGEDNGDGAPGDPQG